MARIFLSGVSSEFKVSYRQLLTAQLSASQLNVEVQEHFEDRGGSILPLLAEKIGRSNHLVHIVGKGTGSKPKPGELDEFIRDHCPDLIGRAGLEAYRDRLDSFTYTQWEFWLGRYFKINCLVYQVDANAERDEGFRSDPLEEIEQANHLARIRDQFHNRRTVRSPWELSSRVQTSLIAGRTVEVPDSIDHPAIVLGFRPLADGVRCGSLGAIRWRGETIAVAEEESLDLRDVKAVCERITALLGAALVAFEPVDIGINKIVVELVLPEHLLTRPLTEWVYHDELKRSPRSIGQAHPLRIRLWGRSIRHPSMMSIRNRLELLRCHRESVSDVCRRLPEGVRSDADPKPLALVHEDKSSGPWNVTAVVCGGFGAPPPRAKPTAVGKPGRRVAVSEQIRAIHDGVPFLIWPVRKMDAEEVAEELRKVMQPSRLCHHFERRPFVVFAESKDPPFPALPPMVSEVNPNRGAP